MAGLIFEVTESFFVDTCKKFHWQFGKYSDEELSALFSLLEQEAESIGEDISLDPVGIACEWDLLSNAEIISENLEKYEKALAENPGESEEDIFYIFLDTLEDVYEVDGYFFQRRG